MQRFLAYVLLIVFAATLTAEVIAQPQVMNLVAMRRKYFANCLWSMDRTKIGGQEVEGTLSGLGGVDDAVMVYELDGEFELLEAMVGYLDSAPDNRSAVFEVWADGSLLQRVGPLHSGQEPEWVRAPLKGARMLTLRIVPDGYDDTHGAAWGSPKLWKDLQGEIPGSIFLKINGRTTQAVPSVRAGTKEVPVPIPLKQGEMTYTVRVKYDEQTGKADVEVIPGGAPR